MVTITFHANNTAISVTNLLMALRYWNVKFETQKRIPALSIHIHEDDLQTLKTHADYHGVTYQED